MTVVNPKSISGITSITTASGSDNLLTIHTSDASNTERFRIDSTGTTKIVTGIVTTLTATTGIATHFTADKISLPDSSDGSLCIGIGSDLKLNHNGTDSFITEVGGGDLYIQGNDIILRDAGTLEKHIEMTQNGAVDLYHNGTKKFETSSSGVTVTGSATVSGDVSIADKIIHTGDTNTALRFPAADTITSETGGTERMRIDSSGRVVIGGSSTYIGGAALAVLGTGTTPNTYGSFAIGKVGANPTSGTTLANIRLNGGSVGTGRGAEINAIADANWSDGSSHPTYLTVATVASSSTSATERIRVHSGGNVDIKTGSLVISTAGQGINFSATNDSGGTMSSELLDDYEEGSWVPDINGGSTSNWTSKDGKYQKIGNTVTCWMRVDGGTNPRSGTSTGHMTIYNIPFAMTTDSNQILGMGGANVEGASGANYNISSGGSGNPFLRIGGQNTTGVQFSYFTAVFTYTTTVDT